MFRPQFVDRLGYSSLLIFVKPSLDYMKIDLYVDFYRAIDHHYQCAEQYDFISEICFGFSSLISQIYTRNGLLTLSQENDDIHVLYVMHVSGLSNNN